MLKETEETDGQEKTSRLRKRRTAIHNLRVSKKRMTRMTMELERILDRGDVKLYMETQDKISDIRAEISRLERDIGIAHPRKRSRSGNDKESHDSSQSDDDDDSDMDLSADTANCDPRPTTTNAATMHLSTAKLSYGNSADKVVCLARTSLPPIESVSIPDMQDCACIHFAKRIKSTTSASEEERRSLIADLNAAIQKMDTKAKSERNPALRGVFASSIANLKMQLETFQSQATAK